MHFANHYKHLNGSNPDVSLALINAYRVFSAVCPSYQFIDTWKCPWTSIRRLSCVYHNKLCLITFIFHIYHWITAECANDTHCMTCSAPNVCTKCIPGYQTVDGAPCTGNTSDDALIHHNVIKWNIFPHYWSSVREIYWSILTRSSNVSFDLRQTK